MPNITIDGPAISLDKKRLLAKRLVPNTAEIYGLPEEAITLIIKESGPENVSHGTVLLVDMPHEK
ncbi:MAG: tautomerase family protein [Clostridiales Family XIII bacterium]|jgi:4-oxalocrotonate tautomerase|nr:tautomerase family protein [Clostridiales Family XIII bacterium]